MTPPSRGEATRATILEGAAERFAAYGFRRTSMDDIATAAGCSRASIYHHFGTKEEVFRTLSAHLHDASLVAMADAAAAPHPDVEARLVALLDARFGSFVVLLHGSPHGAELVDAGHRTAADVVTAAHAQTLKQLAAVLRAAARAGELDLARSGLSAKAAAQALLDGAHGAKDDAALAPADYRRRLQAIVRLLVRGLAPPG